MAYLQRMDWEGIPGRALEQTNCHLGKGFGGSVYLEHGLEDHGIDTGYGKACAIGPIDSLSHEKNKDRRKGRIRPTV